MILFKKYSLSIMISFILIALPFVIRAEVTKWKIVPAESSLTFTAIQNNAPITGTFKIIKGEIFFDPEKLNESKVNIIIPINSLTTSYRDLTITLLTPDWFNATVFPLAIFSAKKFIKTGNDAYQAQGFLTIRNKTIPININFMKEGKGVISDKIKVTGYTELNRTAFGVGQGEWSNTAEIADKVKINFTLSAKK